MPCSAESTAASRPGSCPASVKLTTPIRSVASGQTDSTRTPGSARSPATSRSRRRPSCAPRTPSGSSASARQAAASATAPSDVRRAGLVPLRRRGPVACRRARPRAPRRRRRGTAAPRRASRGGPTRTPAPNGRVQLVAGERDVVHARRGEVDAPVRRELRGVDDDPGAVRVREVRELRDRQQLAGDVARPGDGEQRGGRSARAPATRGHGAARGCARPRRSDAARRSPRQQVRVVLDVEEEHLAVRRDGGGQQVQRVGRVPDEDHDVVRRGRRRTARPRSRRARRAPCSPATVQPAPRWTLPYSGRTWSRRRRRPPAPARWPRRRGRRSAPSGRRRAARAAGADDRQQGGRLGERRVGAVQGEHGHGRGLRWEGTRGVPRLPRPVGRGPVITRSTPPRRRVAGQRAGAWRWHS